MRNSEQIRSDYRSLKNECIQVINCQNLSKGSNTFALN